MDIQVFPNSFVGSVDINPSKSHLHRLLICAALSKQPSVIRCAHTTGVDIEATINCLNALGADIAKTEQGYRVTPLCRVGSLSHRCGCCENKADRTSCEPQNGQCANPPLLPCEESGSTLRFLLPVTAALGEGAVFDLKGRLPQRPLAPLDDLLRQNGCAVKLEGDKLFVSGKLIGERYALPGNVSSQFVSGMLFALSLRDGVQTVELTGECESTAYIDMTVQALTQSGVNVTKQGNIYTVGSGYNLHGEVTVEGDWSGAAFWLCGAAIKGEMLCKGVKLDSLQGDRAVCDVLKRFGAQVTCVDGGVHVKSDALTATDIDVSQIPDLVPPLAVVAALAEGETRIYNAARLRLKESDRLATVAETLSALGGDVTQGEDYLLIRGVKSLKGGTVHSHGDHRIAMMAAVCACVAEGPITIQQAQAVEKSYPDFFEELKRLGFCCEVV